MLAQYARGAEGTHPDSEPARLSAENEAGQVDAILKGMLDGIMVLDSNLRLVRWNEQFPRITGVPSSILRVGLPLEEILRAQAMVGEFGPVDVASEVARRMAMFRAGHSLGVIERKRPNGTVFELRRSRLPCGGSVTLYTEITARRNAEEQLLEAQKMDALGRLTGGVAHDFNNLLTAILGSLELAQKRVSDPQAERFLTTARLAAERGSKLIAQMLAFARRQEVVLGPVDVNAVASELQDMLVTALGCSVALRFALSDVLRPARADPIQLQTALLNLAVNARDAMPDGGELVISTSMVRVRRQNATGVAPGSYIKVSVADTGHGMSEDVRRRAFEPFYTTKPAGSGTGLGLSMVFGFAAMTGGTATIESAPGRGTTISLFLPQSSQAARANDRVFLSAAGKRMAPAAQTRILLVDDDDLVRETMADMLGDMGYEVAQADSGSAALNLLATGPRFDLVMVDFVMPSMDGSHLATELRRIGCDAPLLFVTGYAENEALRPWTELGIPTLAKPFTERALAAAVTSAVKTGLRHRQ